MTFKTANGTGTGMIVLLMDTQDGYPLYDGEIIEPYSPGTYGVYWTASTKPDPDCEIFCPQWLKGNYTVHVGKYYVMAIENVWPKGYKPTTIIMVPPHALSGCGCACCIKRMCIKNVLLQYYKFWPE